MSSFTNDPKKMNRKEEEIYNILYQKKEINDKTPKFRTEDEKKKLKSLSYKISKINKNLIDDIITKFPFLQRKPQTAEQRQEQKRIIEHKRYTQATQFRAKKIQELIEKRSKECPLERERRLIKQKEYENEKRSKECPIERERRMIKDIEYQKQKLSQESPIQREIRLMKQKEYDNEKRAKESQIERQRRLTQDKEYHSQKRSEETPIESEMRLNKQKEYENEKRSAESQIERQRRLIKKKRV